MNRRKFLRTFSLGAASMLVAPNVLSAEMDVGAETVAAIIAKDQDLSSFQSLLVSADLIEGLSEGSDVTVFAPNNMAFENLGEAMLSDLTNPANQHRLSRILNHHVVSRRILPSDLVGGRAFETIDGSKLTLIDGEALRIEEAELIASGIEAPNGYVYKIDTVLIPPQAA